MKLRFQSKAAQVAQGGTAFTHGLNVRGSAVIPNEWAVNLRGPTPGAAVLYVSAAPSTTTITVAASGATGTGDVFASYNHTIIR